MIQWRISFSPYLTAFQIYKASNLSKEYPVAPTDKEKLINKLKDRLKNVLSQLEMNCFLTEDSKW